MNEDQTDPTFFRQIVGSLRYLCNSRPDLVYAVGLMSRYMESPSNAHLLAAKRVLRYVKGTINHGILFTVGPDKSGAELYGYTDAD